MAGMNEQLHSIVDEIELPPYFDIKIGTDWCEDGKFHRYYLQIKCLRADIVTGQMGYGYGGKGYVSDHMVTSEVVAMIFGLYKAYCEHECRETFKYKGRRVYGPHINVESLWEAATKIEVRKQ